MVNDPDVPSVTVYDPLAPGVVSLNVDPRVPISVVVESPVMSLPDPVTDPDWVRVSVNDALPPHWVAVDAWVSVPVDVQSPVTSSPVWVDESDDVAVFPHQ
ncbi:hypothetical protein FRUB_03884 [Fimbriiglobus ruber]|uniref:Uncharacterized protein n=1 Tax=Fimbriiglobus ruber TaxID=1908690 RepID=A0A225DVY7_9BACT|nr:hypothetical protein FRUB_03884 [Fimbriiglobus ruber]